MLDQSVSQVDKQEMLDKGKDFTNQLGILTHHDAVTGTSDNGTVEDYVTRMHKIITKDRKVYSKQVGKQIQEFTGKTFDSEWVSCFRDNSTYFDCPISDHHTADKFYVAIHNPADVEQKYIKIAVPNRKFTA